MARPASVVALAGYSWLQWLGRTSGSTRSERAARRPGDEGVERPHFVTDHAVTIGASAAEIWPWLVQMGWHRAGWYTARWVDLLLFPANEASADRIHAEWQDLAVGDQVPDGAPETECFFVVRDLEPSKHLVLHSRSHLPPDFRDRFRASIDWTWSFSLDDLGDGRTRFHFRSRARLAPWWLSTAYLLAIVPADHIMGRQMLNGVKARAESRHLGSDSRGARRAAETFGALALMLTSPLIRPVHTRWGASATELHAAMPGDDLLPRAQFVATRAITIDAPPVSVWPWLMQTGVGRAGFYSYDLLDHLGHPSATTVLKEWQDLDVGDVVAPMTDPPTTTTSFVLGEIDRPRHMVWSKPDSTWSWTLCPIDGGRTRLVTRLKVRYRLAPSALLTIPLIELGDFAMMRRMLLTLRRRATSAQPPPLT
jgi:hypothetical protein